MEWTGMAIASPAVVLLMVAAVVAGQLAARLFVQASEAERKRRPSR